MLISLHKQANTTPKIRAAIQASTDPAWMVAERYGISEQPVWKWRSRDDVHDRSHTPHRLQTTLTPAQEGSAQGASTAARRSPRRGARVPQPAGLAVGPRPLPAAPWRGQPAGAEAEGAEARAWHLQGLRTRLPAHRREIPAPDGRRGLPPLPLRGHRSGDTLGLRPHLSGADRGQRPPLPARSGSCAIWNARPR